MRFTPRLLASLGALTVTATAVSGLMLSPAIAEEPPATPAATGSLHAWRGEPVGDPDQIFEGFGCQNTDYRFSSWQVVSDGALELWASFEDPDCQNLNGFFDPRGNPQTRTGVGSIQRWR